MKQFISWSCTLAVVAVCSASPLSRRANVTQFTFDDIPTSKTLIWYQCFELYQCARLAVPLDYKSPNGSQASVPIIRVPAQENSTSGSYKGMLLFNPGGPGGSGVNAVLETGILLQSIAGTNYDFVSWDPRGIARALPLANCSASDPLPNPVSRRSNMLPALRAPEFSSDLIEEAFLEAQEQNALCVELIGGSQDAGPHMSTLTNARDMIRIADAFAATDDGRSVPNASLVNFYGASYGSYMGEVFASVFPDRVGKFILDGVTFAADRATGELTRNVISADDVISTFFLYCNLAGPSLCDFYTGTGPLDIQIRFEALLSNFNSTKAQAQNWANVSDIGISLAIIKEVIFDPAAYSPISGFPILALRLAAFETIINTGTFSVANISAASILNATVIEIPGVQTVSGAGQLGVQCSDNRNVYANQTLEDFEPDIVALTERSVIAGQLWAYSAISCANWTIQSDDVFTGPFGGKTKTPILFVSNTLDPVTTYENGVAMSAIYEDSALLTVEGTGHTSTGPLNTCAFTRIQTYLQTGVLPSPSTNTSYCPLEAGPFGIILTPEEIGGLRGMRRGE